MSPLARCIAAMAMAFALPAAAALPAWLDPLDALLRSLRTLTGLNQTLKYSLHYRIDGVPEAGEADAASFRFSGPVSIATVDAASAEWRESNRQVGRIVDWSVSFRYAADAAQPLPLNTQTDVSSTRLRIELADGSVLVELRNDPATPLLPETDVPLRGRMLYELGRIAPRDPALPYSYRVTGCMGVQGIGGQGALDGKRGAFCTSGSFDFPQRPDSIDALRAMPRLGGASGFTLVMH